VFVASEAIEPAIQSKRANIPIADFPIIVSFPRTFLLPPSVSMMAAGGLQIAAMRPILPPWRIITA
jgi:hypothetical protein